MFQRFKRPFSKAPPTTDYSGGSKAPRDTVSHVLPTPPQPAPTTAVQPATTAATATADLINTDGAVQALAGKSATDTMSPNTTFVPRATTAVNNQPQGSHAQSDVVVTDEFQAYWTEEIDSHLEDERRPITNYYTPNAIALLTACSITGQILSNNHHLQKLYPEYIHYGTVIYYSVLFYIQILRVRRSANEITGIERKFLKRFEGKFSPESLTIAGQYFPILSTIIWTDISDGKFEKLVPRIANENFLATMSALSATVANNNGSMFLQPMIPYMVGNLRLYISNIFRSNAIADLPAHFNTEDQIIPHSITAAQPLVYYGIRLQTNTHPTPDQSVILQVSGLSEPTYLGNEEFVLAHKAWQHSKFTQVPFIPYNAGALTTGHDAKITTTDGSTVINSLARFLCMEEDGDLDWFEDCAKMANIQAQFSKKKYNLSNVPTIGGTEPLILGQFIRQTATIANKNDYTNLNLDASNAALDWYTRPFTNMTAIFSTDRTTFKRQEELQALTFATNATLPIIHNAIRVGAQPLQRTGDYFTHPEAIRASHRIEDNRGKRMFSNWNTLYQKSFMQLKPSSI